MKVSFRLPAVAALVLAWAVSGCSTAYVAKPMPFRSPAAYPNAVEVAGATVAAESFADPALAREAFGFDIREAGMLPVQVIFDHRGTQPLEIVSGQTFLEDGQGNIWPLLDRDTAYERATRYAQTKEIVREGAYHGVLGAAAGAVIGAAVGIVTGENVAVATGKGAAVGGAAGATLGGAKGYTSDEARRKIIQDLNRKSLENRAVDPQGFSFGFLFFPGEAASSDTLRLQIRETATGQTHALRMKL